MKRNYCLAVLIFLMLTGIEPTALAVGEGPVDLSGLHKPTYYPYPMASPSGRMTATLDTPIAQSFIPSNSQESDQALVQVRFKIVGESNQPLPGAQFSGRDAANNVVQGITDDNGYVTIVGAPGNWQFLIYVSGYFSDAMMYPFTYSTTKVLQLQQIGAMEELNLSGHGRERDILPTIKITMPAPCSDITKQGGDPAIDQSTYTGDEG
jgi:hypothetical protein